MNVKMIRCLNDKTRGKGLTIIEMLVAVTMFSIAVGAISGIFISGIRTQRRVLATQELLDQTSYVLEYMGRALRMAKKDLTGTCITTTGNNYELTAEGITFIDHTEDSNCTEFILDGVQIKKRIGVDTWDLTSSALQVNFLRFNLSGEPQTDNLQPIVTIFLDVSGRETGFGGRPRIQIQTSVSQRNLDIQY
jgi:prepilin-type N-terminal cleavage/methylation domain-containing protein